MKTSKNKKMMHLAHRRRIEKYEPERRSSEDRRRKVAWAVFSYFTDDEVEFRHSIELERGSSKEDFIKAAPKTIEVVY